MTSKQIELDFSNPEKQVDETFSLSFAFAPLQGLIVAIMSQLNKQASVLQSIQKDYAKKGDIPEIPDLSQFVLQMDFAKFCDTAAANANHAQQSEKESSSALKALQEKVENLEKLVSALSQKPATASPDADELEKRLSEHTKSIQEVKAELADHKKDHMAPLKKPTPPEEPSSPSKLTPKRKTSAGSKDLPPRSGSASGSKPSSPVPSDSRLDEMQEQVDSLRDEVARLRGDIGTNGLMVMGVPQTVFPEEAEQLIQLYHPDKPESEVVQPVILSLPSEAKLLQIRDDLSSEDGGTTASIPPPTAGGVGYLSRPITADVLGKEAQVGNEVFCAPSVVTDDQHRVLFSMPRLPLISTARGHKKSDEDASKQMDKSNASFRYILFDMTNDGDRSEIIKVRHALEDRMKEIEDKVRSRPATSSSSDQRPSSASAELRARMSELQDQISSIDRKLALGERRRTESRGFKSPRGIRSAVPALEGFAPIEQTPRGGIGLGFDPSAVFARLDSLESNLSDVRMNVDDNSQNIASTIAALNQLAAQVQMLQSDRAARPPSSESRKSPAPAPVVVVPQSSTASNAKIDELRRAVESRLEGLDKLVASLLRDLRALQSDHASKADASSLHQLEIIVSRKADRDDLDKALSAASKSQQQHAATILPPTQRSPTPTSPKSSGKSLESQLEALSSAVNGHAQMIDHLSASKADKAEMVKAIMEKGEQIDRLSQLKADAPLVARKAEREYVDSTLERLRRELEQLRNSVGGSLDEELRRIKALLDAKANLADLKRIRDYINTYMVAASAEQQQVQARGHVPEGLLGRKAYICLSCNRTMDGMRVRPKGIRHDGFTNHTTSVTTLRNKSQQAQRAKVPDFGLGSAPVQAVLQSMERERSGYGSGDMSPERTSRNGVLPPIGPEGSNFSDQYGDDQRM